MQALRLLQKNFMNTIPSLHKSRLGSLMACSQTLVKTKTLTLTSLGRHMENDAKMRSNIKKVDRLLGNENLHEESHLFYEEMNCLLISPKSSPWLHIDWTCISSKNKLYALRASLSVKGRSIVVYEKTYPKCDKNNHDTHKDFLKKLKDVLPDAVKPIIVRDAGFRAIWFAHIEQMGWDYVGRIRNKNFVYLEDQGEWQYSKTLYESASNRPRDLGEGLPNLSADLLFLRGRRKIAEK